MKPFGYHEPATAAEACQCLKELGEGARIIAGGTDILIQMKRGSRTPEHLVNISNMDELSRIESGPEGISIGTAVLLSALVDNQAINDSLPMIARAAYLVGSPQVRNLATIGGNICNAAPSADMSPGLVALDSVLTIVGPDGQRQLPISDFFTGPGSVALEHDEILTSIFIPKPEAGTKMLYLKHGPRQAMDCSVTGVALALCVDPQTRTCKNVRLVLGAVAPTPVRARQAEQMIDGRRVDDIDFAAVGGSAASEASPISDVRSSAEYRLEMVSVLTVKALETLVQGV
ncbi:MAG: hypothetical protein CSA21_00940 [Deltaproteobacteria bacterium]|nr:MAG: hypothetical protein CSA21_00940 [Deltaproteobacteria bacterium]